MSPRPNSIGRATLVTAVLACSEAAWAQNPVDPDAALAQRPVGPDAATDQSAAAPSEGDSYDCREPSPDCPARSSACPEPNPYADAPNPQTAALVGGSVGYSRITVVGKPDTVFHGMTLGLRLGASVHVVGLAMVASMGLFDLSIYEPDFDQWMLELVSGGLYLGPELGPLTIYGGASMAWLGFDGLSDRTIVSLLNPRATAGAQTVIGPVTVRAEFHLGRVLRLTSDPDLQLMTGMLTIGAHLPDGLAAEKGAP